MAFELDHEKYSLLLAHAVICAFSFIEPGEHLPPFIFEGSDEEKHFKVSQYTLTHRFYSKVAWMGRKN